MGYRGEVFEGEGDLTVGSELVFMVKVNVGWCMLTACTLWTQRFDCLISLVRS